jgi:hypothetical protein
VLKDLAPSERRHFLEGLYFDDHPYPCFHPHGPDEDSDEEDDEDACRFDATWDLLLALEAWVNDREEA